jgi:hypothetical protein
MAADLPLLELPLRLLLGAVDDATLLRLTAARRLFHAAMTSSTGFLKMRAMLLRVSPGLIVYLTLPCCL